MYADLIKQFAPGHDPRHVEAYMRIEHPTLDGLSRMEFADEVEFAVICITADGLENAELCAKSFGL